MLEGARVPGKQRAGVDAGAARGAPEAAAMQRSPRPPLRTRRPSESRLLLLARIAFQEASYALIPEGDRARVHLSIGRALLARTPADKRDATIFDIVHQLNRGAALLCRRRSAGRSPGST